MRKIQGKKIDDKTLELLKKHGLGKDNVWDCHGTWVFDHKTMESIRVKENINIISNDIAYVDLNVGACVHKCVAEKGKLKVITYGEASPKNTPNKFPVAMSEKRAFDRAVLKLSSLHGDFYSEDEVDLRTKQEQMRDAIAEEEAKNSSGMKIPGDEADNSSSGNKSGTIGATIKPPDSSWLNKNVPYQMAYFSSLIKKATSLDQITVIKSCYSKWFSQLKSSDLHEVNLKIENQKKQISPHSS